MCNKVKSCLGAYEDMDECGSCPLVHICIEATIQADGYYDELAEREQMKCWTIEDALSAETF